MAKFVISTDNVSDFFKSYMDANGIHCITIKRLLGEKVFSEIYDSVAEYDKFYDELKRGAMFTTSQINHAELTAHFKSILEREPVGDIVHVSMSGGLSNNYHNAVFSANEINATLSGRKIYVVDSLTVSGAMQVLIEKLMELNGKVDVQTAIEEVKKLRDRQHIFFVVDDLFNLKRSGRLSATKAVVGTVLGIKPILTVDKEGKLQNIDKVKGGIKAIEYFIAQLKNHNYDGGEICLYRTSKSDLYDKLRAEVVKHYPTAKLREGIIGSIIGTHLGCGGVAICFCGAK